MKSIKDRVVIGTTLALIMFTYAVTLCNDYAIDSCLEKGYTLSECTKVLDKG